MSTINFRLYGDQIYGLALSKVKDRITPEIEKEEFTKMFQDGEIKYDNIQNKEKIVIHPQMTIDNLQIEKIILNIPNETENFSINLSGVKTTIELFNIKENEIENIIIQKRKDLIEQFIAYAVKKIENKEASKSFIEGLIENLINRALNGLKIEINNIELRIKYKKHTFILSIENISYSEESGVQIKNTAILYEEEGNSDKKNYIIKQFNIGVEIKTAQNESETNEINIKLSDFQFELTKNIFLAFNEMFNLVEETKYKNVYARYKKLIQYHRPKKPEISDNDTTEENDATKEKNKYYNLLWLYAIKAVIKLQKYVGYDKLYLFDLSNSIQEKIAKKYLDDNSNTEKLILPTEINLLKATKEKVEQKVLDGKKGNVLSNAFSFFFGGNKEEDEKKELTEDERKIFEDIFTEDYLIKYLYSKTKDENNQSNPIKDKIMAFILKLKININFNKLELILANDDVNKCTLYISNIKLEIDKENTDINSVLTIGIIGSNLDENLFSEKVKINENNDLIMISRDKNNKINVNLGFKNIELSEDLFNFVLIFFSSLKTTKKNRIFKDINYEINPEEKKKDETKEEEAPKEENEKAEEEKENEEEEKNAENENEEEKKVKEESDKKLDEQNKNENEKKESNDDKDFFKNFSINIIPSIVISTNGNKTYFSLTNFSLNPTEITATYNIKDSYGTILDNYTFLLNKDATNNKYILNLKEPLKIKLSSESSKYLFISILKLAERLKQIQKRNKNKKQINTNSNSNDNKDNTNELEEEKELFGFNYVIHKKIDLKNFNINELKIDVLMKKLLIEIYENNVRAKFCVHNFNLTYENKELVLKIEKISIKNNLMSTMLIYLMGFEAPNFQEFQKYIDEIKSQYKDSENNDANLVKIDENKNEGSIKYDFNIDYFLSSFKVLINLVKISFQSGENIIPLSINKIDVQKAGESISVKLGLISLGFNKVDNNSQNMKIFNVDEETNINFDPKKNLVKVRLTTPKVNADLEILKAIQKSMENLKAQTDSEAVLCRADVQIYNGKINLNNEFNISIPNILLKNFDEKSNDTVYLTINDLEVKNKNNELITGQKSININITTKSITELSFLLNFSDLNINLSKNDIEAIFKIVNISKNKEDSTNQIKSDEKPGSSAQKESHEYNISVELNIPLFDFAICSQENRNKICELFLLHFGTKAKIYIPADISKTHNMSDIKRKINVFLGKLKLIYHNENNHEFNIIEYKEKNDFEKILKSKSIINFEPNLNKQNQIEMSLNNEKDKNINEIGININRLGINIKLDILVNLLLYIKGLLPKNIINNENINEIKEIESNNKERQSKIKLSLNLIETQFKLESINNKVEQIIVVDINKLNYIFNSIKERKLPLGNNEIKLDKLSILLINNEENISILKTNNDFILIKADLSEEMCKLNINCNEIMINLSYTDINLIKNIISSNIAYLKEYKDQLIKNENKVEYHGNNQDKLLSLNYNLKRLDFILIDNYSNICHPFINLKLNNISSFVNEEKPINSSVYVTLLTYNYISCIWEPIIENSCISCLLIRKKGSTSMINSIKIKIYKLLLNISDMLISSTVLSLNNLKKALEENKNVAKKSEKDLSQSKVSLSMISAVSSISNKDIDLLPQKIQTNNKVINYTGKSLKIIFNKKTYDCDPSSEVELEYINKWETYKDEKKIKVLYDNNNKVDIPFTKLGVGSYKLNDSKLLVWENIVSKDRQINIFLYSQIILKNKTNYIFHIKVMNKTLGNFFILIKQNSMSGIPLIFCNNNTSFLIKKVEEDIDKDSFEENNNRVDLSDIIGKDKYQKKLNLDNSISLLLQMNKKIDNVSTLLITSEYSIVNCLPCDMKLEVKNRIEKVKKCSQFFIDFYDDSDLDIKLIIKIGQEYYFSNNFKFSKLKNDFDNSKGKSIITFKNHKDQSFNLSFFLKNKDYHKSLIIYSEYIIFNDSGLNLSISSNYLFNIGQNLYLISNKINLEESDFQIFTNDFSSSNIILQEVVKASPYYKLYLNNGNNIFPLSIKKNISFISIRNNPNFKENIISMVFNILPFCKITNLLWNKKLIIKENTQFIVVQPLNQVSFNFSDASNRKEIELGLVNIKEKENKCNSPKMFNLFQCGIYTFFDENGFYNLEIKDSSSEGVLNIFVTESTLENAKIIAINKTNIDFELSQIQYDIYKQVIKGNESQIVKLYDQLYTGFNVKVCGKEFEMKFIAFKEDLQIFEIDRFVLVKESNGVKMKITLYTKDEYDKLNKEVKSFYADLVINNFYISLIGDNLNKNRKLRNYERNEILLLYFQDFDTNLFVNKTKDIILKNNISFNLNLSKLDIYNQFSKKGLFSCIFKNLNTPCMKFACELDLYNKDKVAKINKFSYKVNKLKLNIEPEFILQIINFAENVSFRLGKINFNVDKVFLRTNKNYRDITIKKNIEKYINNQGLICFGSNFNFPSINIDFELTEINLEKLLRDKVGCTDLLVWIGFGLVRQNQNIYLDRFKIDNYFGDFSGLLVKMQNNYKSQMSKVILNIGLSGILGQIKQFFFSGNQTDENSTEVQKNRLRYPRAFYGKYHYIKNYNEEESKIIDKINDLFKNDFKELFCNDILQSKNYIFYFSGSSLFIFTKNYELYYKIDYSNVEKVYNEEENLIIAYKKDNEEENPPSIINCSEVHLSKRMEKLFKKYISVY